jgi:hypothetical protein
VINSGAVPAAYDFVFGGGRTTGKTISRPAWRSKPLGMVAGWLGSKKPPDFNELLLH